ncbi:Isochorismatase [Skermanella stibiiresistens SB22]|uniref:isochorismatase n=1 Tax=Skermanella stibiiresistens SB22 TaxID=1385369 RepID=W9H4L8_9PROT|nr:isochorismatase family protein [Skermanella stibiiresistens]EWY39632.1 Isochorismatase [Skermanella stibiiresistens SB22]
MAIPTIQSYPMPGPADLPAGKVAWRPDPERAVLLIHDMQEYFLDFFDVSREPIPELIANLRRVRERCAALGIPVVFTAQPAEQTPEQRGLLTDMWGHGLKTRPHRQPVIAELAPAPGDVVLVKWRYSAFQRSDLRQRMLDWDRDQLIIGGVYAHIGCMMTAADAFMGDVKPFLVADALADFSAENHATALTWVAQRCGVVTTTASLLDDLGEPRATVVDPGSLAAGAAHPPAGPADVLADVAQALGVPVADIGLDDNLLDHGIDSIRIMSLVERWRRVGAEVTFVELADSPTVGAWWALLATRIGHTRDA